MSDYKKRNFPTLSLNANLFHLVKVSFVRGGPFKESSVVVHTDQGMRERDDNTECEVCDYGGGCFNSEHNTVLLFSSLSPLWQWLFKVYSAWLAQN